MIDIQSKFGENPKKKAKFWVWSIAKKVLKKKDWVLWTYVVLTWRDIFDQNSYGSNQNIYIGLFCSENCLFGTLASYYYLRLDICALHQLPTNVLQDQNAWI